MSDIPARPSRAVHALRDLLMREIAIATAFVVAAIAMTWPLALHPGTAVLGAGDPYVSASILDWDLYALTHHPFDLFQLPVFFPAHDALAFTEHLFGIALAVLPFRLLGASPIALHSIAMILGFAFCGWGASALGRTMTGSSAAGLIGGLCYAFVPYRFHHLTHVSYVWSGWLPLLLASLLWYARLPSWKRAIAFGLIFFFNGITCLHWLAFGSFAVALSVVFVAAAIGRFFDARWWIRIGAATAVASIALLPWLIPYRTVAREYHMQRSWAETIPYSAQWTDWFTPPRENRPLGGLMPDEAYEGEHPLFPGFVVLILTGAAFILIRHDDAPRHDSPDPEEQPDPRRLLLVLDAAVVASLGIALFTRIGGHLQWQIGRLTIISVDAPAIPFTIACALMLIRFWIRFPRAFRERSLRDMVRHSRFSVGAWSALLWIVVGFVGSFGLTGFFHQTLFRLLPPMRGIRVPLRWSMIAFVGLSATAALGMLPLLRRSGRLRRWGITAVVALAILFETRAAPIHWFLAPDRLPPVYTWLAGVRFDGGIVELPMNQSGAYDYLLGQTVHRHPLVNGISSFVPQRYESLPALAQADTIGPQFVDALETLGCSAILVHVDDLYERRPVVRAWLKAELERGRLAFVRRFDEKTSGDYVFAVTRNWRTSAQWRAPERPDASGRTPIQTLDVFLDQDGPTFNSATFGMLSSPAPWQDVRGTLTVSGWALSPNGVKAVNLLFDDHRIRVAATLSEAPWVTHPLPWYPQTTRPAFSAIVPVPQHLGHPTDLQVEIVDGRGSVTHLGDVEFRWSNERGLDGNDWQPEGVRGLLRRTGLDPAWALPALLGRRLTVGDLCTRIVTESKGQDDQTFVSRAYDVLFHRPPDAYEQRRWSEKLARGTWRRDLVESLVQSDEFARDYLRPGAAMEPLR